MKSTLLARFNELKSENIGAIPTLSRAIREIKKCTKGDINKVFKLVPKDEYERSERNAILIDLYSRTEGIK